MKIQSVLPAIVISAILISGRVAAQSSPPSAPASFGVERGNGLVVFKWRPGPDNGSAIEKYQYQQSEDSGSTWSNWTDIVGSDERHANRPGVPIRYIRTGLVNGRRYDFQIRAVSSAGDGAASAIVSATPATVPHIPGNFALQASNGQVTLSWDDPNDATITLYRYNTRHPDQGWLGTTEISNSNATTTTYTVTGLTNNLEYAFTLYAVNSVGNGPTTQRFYATPVLAVSAPAAVTNLAAEAGDQQVTLSWDNPNNASITTYQYRQSEDSGSTYSPDWTNITGSNANTTSHRIDNLTNDTEYTFEIRAVNTADGASVSVSATPVLPPLTVTWPEEIKGTEDSSIWTSLTSTPPDTPQISVSGGRPSYTYEITDGAPDGLSIDLSGTLTGTPTEHGDFEVRVAVRDEAGQSVSNDALSITIRPALSVSPIAYKTVEKDSLITPIHLSASGGWGPYTYSTSDLPAGIVLDQENALITGRPKATGDSDITVTVRDAVGGEASTTFNLSVSAAPTALKIAVIADVTATQNVAITPPIQVRASGGSGSYTYWIGSNRPPASSPLPPSNPPTGSGLSIDSNGRITGTPTVSRDFTITVAVRDGVGGRAFPPQVSRPFTMRVRPRVTVSAIGNITVTQNTAITPIQVSASGGQTPYTYSMSSNPTTGSGLSIDSSSGQITGTPTQTGTFTLTVTVTDNASTTATESFSMAVSLIGDFNDDGMVDTSDHLLFVAASGLSEGDDGFNADMDLDGDGTIGTPDFLIFVNHFGSSA